MTREIERGRREASEIERGRREASERRQRGELYMYIIVYYMGQARLGEGGERRARLGEEGRESSERGQRVGKR